MTSALWRSLVNYLLMNWVTAGLSMVDWTVDWMIIAVKSWSKGFVMCPGKIVQKLAAACAGCCCPLAIRTKMRDFVYVAS